LPAFDNNGNALQAQADELPFGVHLLVSVDFLHKKSPAGIMQRATVRAEAMPVDKG